MKYAANSPAAMHDITSCPGPGVTAQLCLLPVNQKSAPVRSSSLSESENLYTVRVLAVR
jgi:hypothetical protein